MLGERIGGDSSLILEELGNVAGLSDLTGQPDHLRKVVNQEQMMDAPSDEDVQTLVESALSPAEVSLEREAALHVSSQSAPPSARVFNVDGFSCVSYEAVCDILGRAVFVTGDDVYPATWVFTLVATRHEFALHRSQTMK